MSLGSPTFCIGVTANRKIRTTAFKWLRTAALRFCRSKSFGGGRTVFAEIAWLGCTASEVTGDAGELACEYAKWADENSRRQAKILDATGCAMSGAGSEAFLLNPMDAKVNLDPVVFAKTMRGG